MMDASPNQDIAKLNQNNMGKEQNIEDEEDFQEDEEEEEEEEEMQQVECVSCKRKEYKYRIDDKKLELHEMMYKYKCTEEEEEDYESVQYVCNFCLFDLKVQPKWTVNLETNNIFQGVRVLAKFDENQWLHGHVWQYDLQERECDVEFEDNSIGTMRKRFEEVKLMRYLSRTGDECTEIYFLGSIEYLLTKLGDLPNLEFVYKEENLIPPNLQTSLKNNLDKIANSPIKDFSPKLIENQKKKYQQHIVDERIQLLIDPSLFCYVVGKSQLKDGTVQDVKQARRSVNKKKPNQNIFHENSYFTEYSWLPSNFYIDNNSKVQIQSYINGLTPCNQYVDLCADLAKTFEFLIPTFYKCFQKINSDRKYNDVHHLYEDRYRPTKRFQFVQENFRTSNLQVHVKVVNYMLKPGEKFCEGVHQFEGMPSEHVAMNGIYYYEVSENMVDEGLEFERGLTEMDITLVEEMYGGMYIPPELCQKSVTAGTLKMKQGQCIVFPNKYQYGLAGLSNSSETETATLKMLCFFVVDPCQHVISTDDVNDQNWNVNNALEIFELQKASIKLIEQQLPKVVIQKIVDLNQVGWKLQESKADRCMYMRGIFNYNQKFDFQIPRYPNLWNSVFPQCDCKECDFERQYMKDICFGY